MTANDNAPQKIDPARRVFVPIERRDVNGIWNFRTTDGERYIRDHTGAIRSLTPKVNGKESRRARAQSRKQQKQRCPR